MTEEISINSLETLTDYVKNIDNTINNVYASQVPEICKKEPCMLGIDEAGRGPVLGPMVYGISYCPLSKTDTLEELKCADSKALNEEKRDDIFSNLVKSDDVGWAVDVISPNIICNNMLGRSKISLNQISMDSAIALVRRAIADGVNLAEIYVDTVGPPEKYQAYLSKLFPEYIITVAKKADSTYPIVSAASICAKVTRDHCLKNWKFIEGLEKTYADFGSGYPGDPVTKNFLVESFDEVFGFPSLVRFSWSTAQNILDDKAFQVDWEDNDQDENSSPVKSLPITSFFKPHSNKATVKKKHKFFVDCDLENTSEL